MGNPDNCPALVRCNCAVCLSAMTAAAAVGTNGEPVLEPTRSSLQRAHIYYMLPLITFNDSVIRALNRKGMFVPVCSKCGM